jgi:hypothetical protein
MFDSVSRTIQFLVDNLETTLGVCALVIIGLFRLITLIVLENRRLRKLLASEDDQLSLPLEKEDDRL